MTEFNFNYRQDIYDNRSRDRDDYYRSRGYDNYSRDFDMFYGELPERSRDSRAADILQHQRDRKNLIERRTMRLLIGSLLVSRVRTRKLDWYFQ